jgi:predicted GIY-YIG superfamily endonuclease
MAWVYVLQCNDDSLYVGVTTDLSSRVEQHQAGQGAAYTARRLPVTLVYFEEFQNSVDAISRECQLKRWSAEKKRALISGDVALLKRLARRRKRKGTERT